MMTPLDSCADRLRLLRVANKSVLLTLIAVTLLVLVAVPGFAQETTSSVRGTVVTPDGSAASNATVTVTDTRTGSARSVTTSATGAFAVSGLRVGGPYTVVVDSNAYSAQTVTDVFLDLGDALDLSLTLGESTLEEIVVTAAAIQSARVAIGPSNSFDFSDLQAAPAINRDIKDVLRIDPRVFVDEAFVDAVQCAGANPRFNSLTVDGVRLNDNFGLNSNGYPTERMPFSFDAIEQVAVELAPFDVQYGGFTACNINAVTRSGTNEFSGSAFFDYTDDSLSGDKLEGDSVDLGDFDETRYGVSIGGPIVQDKLFFFASYEKLEGADVFDRGPVGSGAGREVEGVSQAQFDDIVRIANDVYGYDPGGLPPSLPNDDEKLLVKFDWNINDSHRAALTYNYNDGFTNSQADSDSNELEFDKHYYQRGAELNAYVGQLFSNWTDDFTTELRIAYSELDNRQIPRGGLDFGEVQITTENDPDGDGVDSRATVYLGADDSRHANKLSYETRNFKLAGSYTIGDNVLSGGYERDEFDVFNLFIQEARGEYRFSSIDDFEMGTPNRVTYENAAPSNVPADAAANFGYEINSLYFQTESSIAAADLSIVAGLRYDWWTSSDVPRLNSNFTDRYGFTNQQNFDGYALLQPRVGITWDATERLSVRGGVGLFAGGNPNVWLSNNYSNDGITQVEVQNRDLDDGMDTLFTIPISGDGRALFNVPQGLIDAVATGTADSGVNALDPDFDVPSEWKFSLGTTFDFDLPGRWGQGYVLNADFLYSEQSNAAIIRDIALEQIGTAVDGRPIYAGIDRSDPDCVDPTSDDCSGRSQDFLLTNVQGDEGDQKVLSFSLAKDYDFGLSWELGYAYVESDDVNPMTSSVAFSNYANIAVSDPNNPGTAQSNYEIPNRVSLRLNFERAFFGDNMTSITLWGTANEGRPFTYTFTNGFAFGDSVGFIDRQLVYVPTGMSDPNVAYGEDFDTAAFFDFVNSNGLGEYGGQILPRNAFHSDWWAKFDLRIEQEFRGVSPEHKTSVFMLIENVGNFLNDDWGVLKEASFPRYQSIVDAGINDMGIYEFNEFFEPQSQSRVTDASLWEIRFGVRYRF